MIIHRVNHPGALRWLKDHNLEWRIDYDDHFIQGSDQGAGAAYHNRVCFRFRTPQDAILFKLTWGSDA